METTDRLYTWLDVKYLLDQNQELAILARSDVYYDNAAIFVTSEANISAARSVITGIFGERYQHDELELESAGGPKRSIHFEFAVEERRHHRYRPQFQDLQLPLFSKGEDAPPAFPAGGPQIFAFHSYKGGVGRTTHLLALLLLASRAKDFKALVIDSDIEAPGISWLAEADGYGTPEISFLDALALWQGDDSEGQQISTALIAERVRSQSIAIETRSVTAQHYYLPTFRYPRQLFTHTVRPEDITRSSNSPWLFSSLILSLANALGVNAVFVDLRAGFSEVSAPLLLDPRVLRFIVSTISEQSIRGTTEVLGLMGTNERAISTTSLPQLILTFNTPELTRTNLIADAEERLLRTLPLPDDTEAIAKVDVVETPFSSALQVMFSLTDAFSKLETSGMIEALEPAWGRLAPAEPKPNKPGATAVPSALLKQREVLESEATKYEYAESGEGETFLSTPQLRALAQRYRDQMPAAVVIGAKGAGKTYTYLQIARRKNWANFAKSVAAHNEGVPSASIWPFLEPKNLSPSAMQITAAAAQELVDSLGVNQARRRQTFDKLQRRLQERGTESELREMWFQLIADSLGIEFPEGGDALAAIVDKLRATETRIVCIVDGLEDIFPNIAESDNQQIAVRSLLQDVINRLQQVPDCPLGIIVFVRADIARMAIPNNFGQFRRLYEAFELKWDREQALRLVYWLGVISQIFQSERPAENLSELDLRDELANLWGKKLGPNDSKEARTTDWVIAALSDFQGRIQARDLVRFLRFSARLSKEPTSYNDRVLVPAAIRGALKPCSEKKIDEIGEENSALRSLFERLRQAQAQKIPLDPVEYGLTRADILLLQDTGVLMEDGGQYYMPEIFRQGLDFKLEAGARPRVLTLAKRALKSSRL